MTYAGAYEAGWKEDEVSPDCRAGVGKANWLYLGVAGILGTIMTAGVASAPAMAGIRSDAYVILMQGISLPIADAGSLAMTVFVLMTGVAFMVAMK